MSTEYTSTNSIPQVATELIPCRIDLVLPGTLRQLLPIPFARLYSVKERRLAIDCFDVLNYTVQLLLDVASHLSPTERERLGDTDCVYVHPESGLLIHTSRSFANFAFECIVAEHNSTDPLILSPSWPSVFFDENGYPSFCDVAQEQPVPPGPAENSLMGEDIPLGHAPAMIPDSTSKKRRHRGLEAQPAQPAEYTTLTFPRL